MTATPWHFRVASDPKWGAGHVVRCLNLAQALREQAAAKVVFHLDPKSAEWPRLIADAGFEVAAGANLGGAGIVLDHPDRKLLAAEGWLGGHAASRFAICDQYDDWSAVDWVIHPHVAPVGLKDNARILAGSAYAMVAPAWKHVRPPAPVAPVREVLIGFGQVDSVNATSAVLRGLLASDVPAELIHIAIGAAAPHREEIADIIRSVPQCRLHVGLTDLRPLVSACGLVIGAGGVSLEERLAAGAVTVAVAQNSVQHEILEALAALSVIVCGGAMPDFDAEAFGKVIRFLWNEPGCRIALSQAAREVFDGRGCHRIAEHMRTKACRVV